MVLTFFRKKRQNLLYSYSVSSFIMRGLGYMDRREWVQKVAEFCQVSEKTAYKWLAELLRYQLIKEKKGVLYIKGKKTILSEMSISSKNAISLDESDLKDKTKYKKILVEQLGLLFQRRYRHAHNDILKYSSESKGRIEDRNGIAFKKHNVGCSLSYLSLQTGLSKSQVARSLTSTRKVSQVVERIYLREFKAKYTNWFFKQSNHLSYTHKDGVYTIHEKLPSVIEAYSKLKRSGL
jgi:hypothetical protein